MTMNNAKIVGATHPSIVKLTRKKERKNTDIPSFSFCYENLRFSTNLE